MLPTRRNLCAICLAPLLLASGTLVLSSCQSTEFPDLQDQERERNLVVGQVLAPIRFANTGERGLSRCSASPALPDGLITQPTPDRATCEIVGTPMVSASRTPYTIEGSNRRGADAATITLTVHASLTAPSLADANSEQSYNTGEEISRFVFVNNGGENIFRCSVVPALPPGLDARPTADNNSCVISGMPTTARSRQTYVVTAWNLAGGGQSPSSADIIITIGMGSSPNTGAPALIAPNIPSLTEGQTIEDIVFTNNGGAPAATNGCVSDPLLPNGLSIERTDDGNSCRITGRPSIEAQSRTYEITARNDEGSSIINVTIAVNAAPDNAAPLLRVPVISRNPVANVEITPIIFVNDGGAPNDPDGCSILPNLPLNLSIGLTTEKNSCQITGTPLGSQMATSYSVTARNDEGSSTVTLSLTIQ